MKFLKVRLENFLTIGDSGWLTLDARGLVLVQGVNEDDTSASSNGAGKSSILDGLCWSLYGVTARDETGDAVVNRIAKKECKVTVVLQDGDSIYEIARHRKHKTHKNAATVQCWNPASSYPAGAAVDMAKGTEKETQELIESIMGCSLSVFVASIYAGQEAMPDLPRMTDKQLKLLIEEAAGVERLENAYKIASTKRNAIESSMTVAKTALDRMNADLASNRANLSAHSHNHDNFEAQRPGKADACKAAATEAAASMRKLHGEYTAMKPAELAEEQKGINEKLTDHNAYLIEHRRLVDVSSNLNTAATRAAYDLDAKKKELERTVNAAKNVDADVGKPCDACGKAHTADDAATRRAHLATKARELAAQAATLTENWKAAQQRATEAVTAANEYRATIPDVSALSARNAELTAKIRQADAHAAAIRAAKATHDNHMAAAERAMAEVNPYKSGIELLNGQIRHLESEIASKTALLEKLQEDLDIAAAVAKVFSPAGVRAHILDTVTPFLNERTSDYLNALSDGNISAVWSTLGETTKGEVREKFNIDVKNDKGAESFKGLSGGEKRKVRLATMLALQDLVASRATKPIDLYMADEIDEALDSPGIERLMGILETKARERGTVVVISHNDMRDWIDQVVTVTKSGGKSKVEGALSL